MNFADFYKPQLSHKKKMAKYLEMKGFLKKKKEKSMTRKIGFFDKSQKQYFQFFNEGKIFAYFEEDPTKSTKVYNYVYMADVNQVQENLDGKSNHFGIVTDDGTITFKCEDEKLKKKWINTIKHFSAMYSPLENQKCKDLVEEQNVQTLAIIQREIEIQQWNKFNKFLDYSNFIKAKGLVPIFTKNDQAVLKHRILISHSSMNIESKEAEQEKKLQRDRKTLLFNKADDEEKADESNQYFMLITQKQSYKLDYKYREKKKIILTKNNLILGYDFDIIYMFNMKDQDDFSASYKFIKMDEIQGAWVEKNSKSLKLILNTENIFINFQTSIELLNWIEALDHCYDESFQKNRLELEYIKFDVDFFYEIFLDLENPKRFKSLLDALNKLPNKEDPIEDQIEDFKEQNLNIKDLIDCFYSNKPFYAKMFVKIMNHLHTEFLTAINNFWKVNIVNIESEYILSLLNILNDYQELLKKWKFVYKPIFYQDTFFNCYLGKEFQEQNENIYNILNDFSDNISNLDSSLKDFKGCISNQTQAIKYFNQRREIVQLYQNISIVVGQFFSYVINVLQKNSQKLENLIDILNQSFVDYFNEVIQLLVDNCQKKLSQKEIEQIILQDDLQIKIEEINTICNEKLHKRLLYELDNEIIFGDILCDINIKKNLRKPLGQLINKIQKLNDNEQRQKLIEKSLDKCCDKYIYTFLDHTDQIDNNNKEEISLQLSQIQNCFKQQIKENKLNNEISFLRIKYLLKLFQTNNLDEFIMYVLKLNVFSRDFTEQENIKKLIRTKIYFPQESIDYLRTFFENITPTEQIQDEQIVQVKENIQQFKKRKTKSSQSFYYVVLFIKKLSNLKRKKSKRKKRKGIW